MLTTVQVQLKMVYSLFLYFQMASLSQLHVLDVSERDLILDKNDFSLKKELFFFIFLYVGNFSRASNKQFKINCFGHNGKFS